MSEFVDPTKTVFQTMRTLRHMRRWSAQKLADRLTEVGRPTERSQLASWEIGKVKDVPVGLLFALAHVFEVPISTLLGEGPVCASCNDAPPAGYSCLACNQVAKKDRPGVDAGQMPVENSGP